MKTSNRNRFTKKIFIYGALAALVLGGATYGGLQYFSDGPTASVATQTGKTLYTCSMHPHIIRDEPGVCPICGMDLTPFHDHSDDESAKPGMSTSENQSGVASQKKEENGAGESEKNNPLVIRVASNQIQKMGVVTEIARKKIIAREIRSVAHVDYNESAEVMINSRVDGWVEKLYARYTGQRVRKGEAIAAIYSPELVSTQEEYLQLYQRARTVESDEAKQEIARLREAARNRLLFWNITPAQIKNIETTGKAQRLLTIYSPYSGVVVDKKVTEGAYVKAGTDLFKVVDLSTVWAYVHIPEKNIPFVSENMPATMEITQLPGRTFKGVVSFVFPFMDAESRNLKIRLSFANPGFELKPGMYATIVLNKTLANEQLVIPSSAVIRTGTREVVFVYHGNGAFEAREVQTGVADGEEGVQILKGVAANEAVVVSGQFLLDSESRLQEVVRKMRAFDSDGSANADTNAAAHNDANDDESAAPAAGGHNH